jgi:hypothetical protein
MDEQENTTIEIDEKKLKRMELRIYDLETKNLLNNEKTSSQMIDAIKKVIEEEVRKCY